MSLKQKKTGVALRVEDNGCGLMEEDPIENNRRFLSGAKLGLRICKLICRRAGWKLTLTAVRAAAPERRWCSCWPPARTSRRNGTPLQRGERHPRSAVRKPGGTGDPSAEEILNETKSICNAAGTRGADAFDFCAGQGREAEKMTGGKES